MAPPPHFRPPSPPLLYHQALGTIRDEAWLEGLKRLQVDMSGAANEGDQEALESAFNTLKALADAQNIRLESIIQVSEEAPPAIRHQPSAIHR